METTSCPDHRILQWSLRLSQSSSPQGMPLANQQIQTQMTSQLHSFFSLFMFIFSFFPCVRIAMLVLIGWSIFFCFLVQCTIMRINSNPGWIVFICGHLYLCVDEYNNSRQCGVCVPWRATWCYSLCDIWWSGLVLKSARIHFINRLWGQ